MEIYNKYKDHPAFAMYELYHWEAHPSDTLNDSHEFIHPDPSGNFEDEWWRRQPFKKPNGVGHRIIHYECYKEEYPDVTMPGLIDDGPDGNYPVNNTGCLVSKKFKAKYTSVVTIGLDGKCIYASHWPPGPGGTAEQAVQWVGYTYDDLDDLLYEQLPTPVIPVEEFSTSPQKFIRINTNGIVFITMPAKTGYSVGIFDMTGRLISVKQGSGSVRYNLSGTVASGVYVVRLTTGGRTFTAPLCISQGGY